jgi:hypothetical protein
MTYNEQVLYNREYALVHTALSTYRTYLEMLAKALKPKKDLNSMAAIVWDLNHDYYLRGIAAAVKNRTLDTLETLANSIVRGDKFSIIRDRLKLNRFF